MGKQYISVTEVNRGGLADSKYMGLPNTVASIIGFDLHSIPGIMRVNQKLVKDSGSTVDNFCKASVACSDGSSYWFDNVGGKIWKRSVGSWSLVATVAPAAGAIGILSAREYQGYVYYATQNRLGRWQVGSAWSTRDDNWKTFTNGEATYHPMEEVNQVLYIGDKNYVAQVDAGVFSANALDLATPFIVSALKQMDTDLLIGTRIADNVNRADIFRWNTWSVSFTNSDSIPENGINSFLDADDLIICNAGQGGSLYYFDGIKLKKFKSIPGDYSPTKTGIVYPSATGNLKGIPLFGFSNVSGNPTNCGIYSFGSKDSNYPTILSLENMVSPAVLSNIEIGSILVSGSDVFVSWKDNTVPLTPTYGVDKLDYSTKFATAYFETRVSKLSRMYLDKYAHFIVNYASLPTGTSINIYVKANYAASWGTALTTKVDAIKKQVIADVLIPCRTIEVRVEAVSTANLSPDIEELIILPAD